MSSKFLLITISALFFQCLLCINAAEQVVRDGNWIMPGLKAIITHSEDSSYAPDAVTQMKQTYTTGLLHGVVGASHFWVEMLKKSQPNPESQLRGLLIPPNTTTAQLARVVYNYLTNNPEQLSMPAELLIMVAISEKFAAK